MEWGLGYYLPHYLQMLSGDKYVRPAYWDGTQNQPLDRLMDPLHKDACNIYTM